MSPQIPHANLQPVHWTVFGLWLATGLVVLLAVISWLGLLQGVNDAVLAILNFLLVVLLALVTKKVYDGQIPARRLLLLIHLAGLLMSCVLLLADPETFVTLPSAVQTAASLQMALQAGTLVLMLSRTFRLWLQGERPKRRIYYY
jgi:hypothetical protein